MESEHTAGPIGAYAVVRGDEPRVFVAESAEVISRLLARELVANASPSTFASPSALAAARSALLEERWADAVLLWISATGLAVDVYPEEVHVWSESDLDAEQAVFEVRMAQIFDPVRPGEPESAGPRALHSH